MREKTAMEDLTLIIGRCTSIRKKERRGSKKEKRSIILLS